MLETILVAGVGDDRDRGESRLIPVYAKRGIRLHPYMVDWAHGDFEPKLDDLCRYIADNNIGAAIGYSAGGVALRHAKKRLGAKLGGVVGICSPFQDVNLDDPRVVENPALRQALEKPVDLTPEELDDF